MYSLVFMPLDVESDVISPDVSEAAMAFSTRSAAAVWPMLSSIIWAAAIVGQRAHDSLAGVLGGRAVDGLEHAHALGVDVARGGQPHTALDDGAEVGDDVTHHVAGNGHVEPLRGFFTIHMQAASMKAWSVEMSSYSLPTSSKVRVHSDWAGSALPCR